ncbi:MAG: hypothetical protein AAB392_02020 [Patescibacteria group bacterium]
MDNARKNEKFIFILALFLLLIPVSSRAETIISSSNISNITTWDSSGSPYIITGNIEVSTTGVLNIGPGTQVKVQNGKRFDIQGIINVLGSENEPVTFVADTDDGSAGFPPSPSLRWGGFVLHQNSQTNIEYASLKHANIALFNTGGQLSIKHSNLIKNADGVNHFSGTTTIKDSLIQNNVTSVLFEGGYFLMERSTIEGSFGYAFVSYDNRPGKIILNENIFLNNTYDPFINTNLDFDLGSTTFVGGEVGTWRIGGSIHTSKTLPMGTYAINVILVEPNGNLTIEPGTNLKIQPGGALYARGGKLHINGTANNPITLTSITNVLPGGIVVESNGELDISYTRIIDQIVGIENQTTDEVIAENNWWGDPSGPTHITNPSGIGTKALGNIDFTSWLTNDPFLAPPVPTLHPLIIIPGIMGSAYKNGEWTIDPVFHVYDNLIETLDQNGYSLGTALFTFPYDWKKSNVESGELLKQKINEVKQICLGLVNPEFSCDKVDIVAHSMGGLVARSYAQSVDYENDIDQLIFLGTPHRGAPKDYLTWEAGEIFGKDVETFFLRETMKKDAKRNGYNNLFDYVKEWPIYSVEQLLPTYDYLKDASSGELLSYPVGYPQNSFLENLNQSLVSLLESDIEITNIVGETSNNTISAIRITDEDKLPLWEHGYPENYDSSSGDHGLEVGIGDGTVPEYSSQLGDNIDLIINSGHVNLPTDAEEEIYEIIDGGELINPVKRSIPLRILYAKIFSPADFVIIAPDGKKVGKDFSTGQEINQISGAFYSGFNTDDEYITIPDPIDGEYKIELQGTGFGGEYSFETTYISDATSTTSSLDAVIGSNQISNLVVDIDNSNPVLNLNSTDPITTSDLLNHINIIYQIGWIGDEKVKDKLVKWAESIVRLDTRNNTKVIDKKLARMLYNELPKLLADGDINTSAYNLLKKDLEWLINN